VLATAADWLGRPVRWRGISFGTVADVLLDETGAEAIGFEVACADGRHRFLALTACRVGATVEPASPLVLLEPAALDYYRESCSSLRASLSMPAEALER
jgi:hypothetical protein